MSLRNQSELDAFLRDLYDPASPRFHHFLTPAQFTAQFSPTEADYQSLAAFLKTQGFQVTGPHRNHLLLDVEGTVPTVEATFHVTMQQYRHPSENRVFYAPNTAPSIDSDIPIVQVSGLDNYTHQRPFLVPQPQASKNTSPRTGSGPSGTYGGSDFRSAYVPGTTLTGAGQSIALVEFDGYYASDITDYQNKFGLSAISLVNIAVSGGISTPGSDNDEVALDIEMANAMAPGLSTIYVYEAPNGSSWDTMLNQIATDDTARQISCSWGGGGVDPTAENIFKQMATQGQSFFTSSGDSDAYTGAIPFPAESVNVTAVGGTTLTTGTGASYSSEKVWNWGLTDGSYEGSSGGISTHHSIPSYQQNISMANNQGSTIKRNVPDVALTGDNIYVTYNNGSNGPFGGTSCAAPLWAGLAALANQQAAASGHSPLGFINPAIYALANGSTYATNFHDVTSGNNFSSSSPSKFSAVSGYDLCTGLGTPIGPALINTLAGPPNPPVITVASSPTATTGQSFSYQITASNNPTSYAVTNLPPGLGLDTTAGVISGTPTSGGTYTVGLTATNAGGSGTGTLTIVVQQAPTITNGSQPMNASTGASYSFTFTDSGYPQPTFAVTGGSLPPGLTLSSSGVISGRPTAAGTFTGTITVTNAAGSFAQNFSIWVADAADNSPAMPPAGLALLAVILVVVGYVQMRGPRHSALS